MLNLLHSGGLPQLQLDISNQTQTSSRTRRTRMLDKLLCVLVLGGAELLFVILLGAADLTPSASGGGAYRQGIPHCRRSPSAAAP